MGSLMNQPIRPALREPLYNALGRIGGIDLDETRYPLRSYKCIGHLFARTLKDKEREIEDIGPDSLVSVTFSSFGFETNPPSTSIDPLQQEAVYW